MRRKTPAVLFSEAGRKSSRRRKSDVDASKTDVYSCELRSKSERPRKSKPSENEARILATQEPIRFPRAREGWFWLRATMKTTSCGSRKSQRKGPDNNQIATGPTSSHSAPHVKSPTSVGETFSLLATMAV